MIFTGFHQEKLTDTQTIWWFAFLFSLTITSSTSATTLGVLIYFEAYYIVVKDNDQTTTGKSAGSPGHPDADINNSASFKTVLTINSALQPAGEGAPNDRDQNMATQDELRKLPLDKSPVQGFKSTYGIQNLGNKNPVTVIDMRKNPKDRALAPTPPPVSEEFSLIGHDITKKGKKAKKY